MATITKRGKSWLVRVRLKGFTKTATFTTKGQASYWATQVEAEIISGTYKTGTEKTFVDAVNRYGLEVTPKKKSARNELMMLEIIKRVPFAQKRLSDVTTEDLAQYRDTELTRIKASSVLRYLSLISSIFEQARREWQWIAINPAKDVKKPSNGKPRDRIFTDDEIERLLAQLSESEIDKTIGDAFQFALATGMRAGEILKLQWANISGREAVLFDTKNGDKRGVPLSKKAMEILERRNPLSKPFNIKPGTLASRFRIYLDRAGIVGACFHDSRHTFISRAAISGKITPFELARVAGHRNLSQTLAYFSASANDLADKLD